MASSMTMPTASVSASSVIELSVKPAAFMIPKVLTMLVGMATAAMIVERALPRKAKTISAAQMAPRTRCSFTAPTAFSMNSDWSRAMSIEYPAGRRTLRSRRRSFTVLTTSTVLVPLCLRTLRMTVARWPLKPADTASAVPSSTMPMSPMRTA